MAKTELNEKYTHLEINTETKKCTMCMGSNLIRLPEEFQVYARKKHFNSFFCFHCIQIINFMDDTK